MVGHDDLQGLSNLECSVILWFYGTMLQTKTILQVMFNMLTPVFPLSGTTKCVVYMYVLQCRLYE